MTSSKTLFLRKDPDGKQSLAQWWTSICRDPRFDLVLMHARAELMELKTRHEHIVGAEVMINTLLTLPDAEEPLAEYPNPNLHHHFDNLKPSVPNP